MNYNNIPCMVNRRTPRRFEGPGCSSGCAATGTLPNIVALLANLIVALAPGVAQANSSLDVVVTPKAFTTIASPGAPPFEARLARVVSDDRCPARVLCVWAGPTVVEIDVRSVNSAALVTLNSKDGKAAHFLGWSVELQYLEPQPLEPEEFQKLKPLDTYRAVLRASHP